jgi:RNA polymerase sigma-70 factor (ECF subfamily)
MSDVRPDSAEIVELLARVAEGDAHALGQLHDLHRPAMRTFIDARLPPDLRQRFDASDVIQEAWREVARRITNYLDRRPMPFHLWVRRMAHDRLRTMCRDHRAERRDPDREVVLPDQSALRLAAPLLGATPSQTLEAQEFAQRVTAAIADLKEDDREILLLRLVDELSYEEAAALLEIEVHATRQRYGRALRRLKDALKDAGLLE